MRPDESRNAENADPELNGMLAPLDHPLPRVDAAAIVARARTGRSPWLRRAAVVALSLGAAGAAWALPGSPVPGWVRGFTGPDAPEPPVINASPTAPPGPIAPESSGGVALDATTPQVIVFEPTRDARVDLSVVPTGPITLRHVGGTARFNVDADRTRVDAIEPGTRFLLEVPAGAWLVDVRVGDRTVWRSNLIDAASSGDSIPLDP